MTDPVTGESRRFSNEREWTYNASFRHDLPELKMAWGASTAALSDRHEYKVAEDILYDRPTSRLDFFVESPAWIPGATVRLFASNIFHPAETRVRTFYQADPLNSTAAERSTGIVRQIEEHRDRPEQVDVQPAGVVLGIAPWNVPVILATRAIAVPMACGNTVILKPSEMTPHVSAIMIEVIRQTFPENEVAVFEGATPTSTALLALPFDHIFFTGSPAVGKIVMAAAAKHLTSVTLELGGKSPTDRRAHV